MKKNSILAALTVIGAVYLAAQITLIVLEAAGVTALGVLPVIAIPFVFLAASETALFAAVFVKYWIEEGRRPNG